mmetsp:Transcript_12034/g.18777  ORF Transcript_12034/g.18777 Transcript_12034/m.18777 type:complete len:478 (-) Transcript_12034:89-1522(-)
MSTSAYSDYEIIAEIETLKVDTNTFWLLFGASLVFFMQSGFAFLEVGCVQQKNAKSILLVNIIDASLSALMWWGLGYGIAMGSDTYEETGYNGFIGRDGYFLTGKFRGTDASGYDWGMWLFQWAFAATTATIVNGAVVERVCFGAYIIYSICLTGFIYPLIVHWGWSAGGWASAWREDKLLLGCGIIDFAGSGVIHTTGGVAALLGAYMIGPRKGRFSATGEVCEIPQLSWVYQTLGTLFLWFGWFGFNGVSSMYAAGGSLAGARAMVNTTISGGAGCISGLIVARFVHGYIDPASANNGLLGGLVAITAGCGTSNPEGAFVTGLIAGAIYVGASVLMLKLRIDDVVDAAPVHLFCGSWGFLAAGLFAAEDNYSVAFYSDRADKCCGAFYGCGGKQFGANFIFLLVIIGFTSVCSMIMYTFARYTTGFRVPPDQEDAGMDQSKHGGISDYAIAEGIKMQTGASASKLGDVELKDIEN